MSVGHDRSFGDVGSMFGLPEADMQGAFPPFCLDSHTENPVGGGIKISRYAGLLATSNRNA